MTALLQHATNNLPAGVSLAFFLDLLCIGVLGIGAQRAYCCVDYHLIIVSAAADQVIVAARRAGTNLSTGEVLGRACVDPVSNLVPRAEGATLDDPIATEANTVMCHCLFTGYKATLKAVGIGADRSAGTLSNLLTEARTLARALGFKVLTVSVDA